MSESLEQDVGELKGLVRGLTDLVASHQKASEKGHETIKQTVQDHMDREDLDRKAIVESLALLHEGQGENRTEISKLKMKFGMVGKVGKWVLSVLTTVLGAYLISLFVGG
jgi:hypothetical protein